MPGSTTILTSGAASVDHRDLAFSNPSEQGKYILADLDSELLRILMLRSAGHRLHLLAWATASKTHNANIPSFISKGRCDCRFHRGACDKSAMMSTRAIRRINLWVGGAKFVLVVKVYTVSGNLYLISTIGKRPVLLQGALLSLLRRKRNTCAFRETEDHLVFLFFYLKVIYHELP